MAEPTLLYVSDDSERFTQHGQLFRACLPSDGSTIRFLFDHVDGAESTMRVVVGIYNRGTSKISRANAGAFAGPDADGMNIGHLATLRFLQRREIVGGSATSLAQVQPSGTVTLVDYVLQPGRCVAGSFDITSNPN